MAALHRSLLFIRVRISPVLLSPISLLRVSMDDTIGFINAYPVDSAIHLLSNLGQVY